MKLTIPYNFTPRPYQLPIAAAFDKGTLRFVDVWHRRAGKDKLWLNLTIKGMMQRIGTYYHVFPTYAQGKKILWEGIGADGQSYLSHFPPQLIRKKNEAEMSISLRNGSKWQVVGSDTCDGDALVGTNPIGIVFSEYALQNPIVWDKIRPIMRENGGWAAFIYTPRGHNHGYDLYEMARTDHNWHTSLLTVKDTIRGDSEGYRPGEPVVTEKDVLEEIAQGMDEDLAQQEFYCSFEGPQQGNYYGKVISDIKARGQVRSVPHDPKLLVHTFWDLGIDDYTAIWFMQDLRGVEYRFIDYYEASGYALDHYVRVLRDRPYNYGTHWLPHDIEVRELGTGKSRIDTLVALGIKNYEVVPAPPGSLKDGIDQCRLMLPLCWFDEQLTKTGLNALVSYKREFDERKKKFKEQPLHDWASHAADSFRQFAMGYKEKKAVKKRQTPRQGLGSGAWMR